MTVTNNRFRRPYIRWIIVGLLVVGCYQLLFERRMFPAQSGVSLSQSSNTTYRNAEDSSRIRVSTFNIHKASGDKDGADVDISDIAAALSDDDLIGIQEVLGDSIFGEADQAEQIATLNKTGWLFAPTQTRFNRVYTGNGLLSKFPTSNWQIDPLIWSHSGSDKLTSGKHRNLIRGDIQLSNKRVAVFVTHIDRREIRPAQLLTVLEEFTSHDYAILLGDLNTHPGEKVMMDWLSKSTATDMIAVSNADHDTENRVDWILTRGFKFIDGGSIDNKLSDHPYFWAEIELLDE